ncbi:transglutaminase N-terminal domain-containing protein [Altericista sp. CCNU0014]|uniref:transglutaminase family protein n=1 Tax=Altericista sp. CCNU0014 TaxID=3082949 RepID=UPI00384E6475
MKYTVTHSTTYTYGCPVFLNPHVLRLQPRTDGFQHLQHFKLQVTPAPQGQNSLLDIEGNLLTRCWWLDVPTQALHVTAISEVETLCDNPFNYLLEPWATRLPFDYPTALAEHLQPYLTPTHLGGLASDPAATHLAQEIAHAVHWNPIHFLGELNQRIYRRMRYQVREEGDPQPPSITWMQQSGTCRDFVVLFMAACRAVGLAARFASGYEQGDPAYEQMLHAWAEVYLPGAGWRGYDPTMGLVVSDRHIAVAASEWPRYAAPIDGTHRGGSGTAAALESKVSIHQVEDR